MVSAILKHLRATLGSLWMNMIVASIGPDWIRLLLVAHIGVLVGDQEVFHELRWPETLVQMRVRVIDARMPEVDHETPDVR